MQYFYISSSSNGEADLALKRKMNANFHLYSSMHPLLEWEIDNIKFVLIGKLTSQTSDAMIKTFSSKDDFKDVEGRYVVIKADDKGNIAIWADKYSRRDVYYSHSSNVIMASSITLFDDLDWTESPDHVALAHSLTIYGSRPAKEQTFNSKISRLGLGETLNINNENKLSLNSVAMDIFPTNYSFGRRELAQYKDMFFDAIKSRGSEDGNLVFLSSGWDSTAITAVLVHVFGKNKVRGIIGKMRYSSEVGGENKFEIEKAQKFAEYFGIKLHETTFDYTQNTDDLIIEAKKILKPHNCNNMTGLNHINLYKKATEISNGDEVVFAGEISDGAHNLGFSQYTTIFHPSSHDFREYSDKMASYLFGPSFLKVLMSEEQDKDPIWNQFKAMNSDLKFADVLFGEDLTLQFLSSFFLRQTRMPLMSPENIKILTHEGLKRYLAVTEKKYLKPMVNKDALNTLYSTYLKLYHNFHWQGGTVATLEICSDYFGLDFEMPFLDGGILDLLEQMPEHYGRGLDFKPTKYPLKHMLENHVDYPMEFQTGPHSYLYDINPDFNHSAELVYRSDLTKHLKEGLCNRQFIGNLDPNIVNFSYIDDLIKKYLRGEEVRGFELNDTFSLGLHSVLNS